MKIAILGAGAMGSAIGALLAKAGNDVTLIDVWKGAVEAINRDGLKIQRQNRSNRRAEPPCGYQSRAAR